MTDTELTVLAAKAYGDPPIGFSPLTDDGDEARLETVLGLDVVWHSECVFVGRKLHRNGSAVYAEEFANHGGDKRAARRRAGVRAAAAMAPESDARDPSNQEPNNG